jgi:hypothetical protein
MQLKSCLSNQQKKLPLPLLFATASLKDVAFQNIFESQAR